MILNEALCKAHLCPNPGCVTWPRTHGNVYVLRAKLDGDFAGTEGDLDWILDDFLHVDMHHDSVKGIA